MESTSRIRNNITTTASQWSDPEHPPRQAAVEETLAAPNQWTDPALDHALNRWMQQLTPEALERWLGDEEARASDPLTVGVIHGDGDPFSGFRDAMAAWGLGFDYVGTLSDASPAILPAFAEEVFDTKDHQSIEFVSKDALFETSDAVIAHPNDDIEGALRERCEKHDIPPSRCLVRSPVYSVGLVDGHESEDEMERLAEDMLLYEGHGRRRLAVIWAPREHPPDAYLEAMARFRGLFPAHEDTPGTLQMQQAFLEARDESHAYADGLEFLVSRGDPIPQRAGHIRWAEYDDEKDVIDWVRTQENDVYAVIARRHLHDQLPDEWTVRTPGGVHIPPLDDADGQRTVTFLTDLAGGD